MSSWNKKKQNDDENEEKASTSSAKSQRIEKLTQENELDELYGYQEPEEPVSKIWRDRLFSVPGWQFRIVKIDIFRSAGIRSAEPSNFIGKIGESTKSENQQNRGLGEIGESEKFENRQNRGIGKSGLPTKSTSDRESVGVALKIFCRIGCRSAKLSFFAEIATLFLSNKIIIYNPASDIDWKKQFENRQKGSKIK